MAGISSAKSTLEDQLLKSQEQGAALREIMRTDRDRGFGELVAGTSDLSRLLEMRKGLKVLRESIEKELVSSLERSNVASSKEILDYIKQNDVEIRYVRKEAFQGRTQGVSTPASAIEGNVILVNADMLKELIDQRMSTLAPDGKFSGEKWEQQAKIFGKEVAPLLRHELRHTVDSANLKKILGRDFPFANFIEGEFSGHTEEALTILADKDPAVAWNNNRNPVGRLWSQMKAIGGYEHKWTLALQEMAKAVDSGPQAVANIIERTNPNLISFKNDRTEVAKLVEESIHQATLALNMLDRKSKGQTIGQNAEEQRTIEFLNAFDNDPARITQYRKKLEAVSAITSHPERWQAAGNYFVTQQNRFVDEFNQLRAR